MNTNAFEVNFDGIVGPTHNYSGLSYGNRASMENQQSPSSPKAAALQGLEKMWTLASLGFKQAVLPPHERPHIPTLKALGYQGSDADILTACKQKDPEILASCSSASAMWAANAATTSPSIDSIDQRVHFTPANLSYEFHRSIEADFTARLLKTILRKRYSSTIIILYPAVRSLPTKAPLTIRVFASNMEILGCNFLFMAGNLSGPML